MEYSLELQKTESPKYAETPQDVVDAKFKEIKKDK